MGQGGELGEELHVHTKEEGGGEGWVEASTHPPISPTHPPSSHLDLILHLVQASGALPELPGLVLQAREDAVHRLLHAMLLLMWVSRVGGWVGGWVVG